MRHLLILIFCFLAGTICAQNRAIHIVLGSTIGTLGSNNKLNLTPRPGFTLGLEYWGRNAKDNAWSAGLLYSAFRRVNETQKESFEYLTFYSMPLMWALDKKNQWFFQGGLFGNYLLGQSLDDNGNVINDTKKLQRLYFGPSVGIAARLGQEDRSRILLGLRNDFGAIGFGNGIAQRFNTISLIAGIDL
jgi:hypothetical protein